MNRMFHQTTACCLFPFYFCRQTLIYPLGVSHCSPVTHISDRIVIFTTWVCIVIPIGQIVSCAMTKINIVVYLLPPLRISIQERFILGICHLVFVNIERISMNSVQRFITIIVLVASHLKLACRNQNHVDIRVYMFPKF